LNLPQKDEFDEYVTLYLTRKQNTTDNKKLKFLPHKCVFDYLPSSCKKHIPVAPYELKFRVVRFKLTESTYEVLITNLDKEQFDINELKKLYAMRWGIENSFRDLKYTLALSYVHSKKRSIFSKRFLQD
jgi:IS4 transposase